MLNELLEFRQYDSMSQFKSDTNSTNTTYSYCNIIGNKLACSYCGISVCPFRLSYAQLSQELSGIHRPLEIVAREAMFKGKKTPNIRAAKAATTHWLKEGLSYEYLDQIYPKNASGEKAKDGKDLELLKKQLNALRARYQKSLFKQNPFEVNDINVCRIDKIIASAIEKGPLKKYVLIAKENPWGDKFDILKYKKERSQAIKLSTGEKDYLLKLTAAFLIERKDSQACLKLTESDILNWGVDHFKKNVSFYSKISRENVFTKEYVTQSTTPVKFRFIEKWTSNFEIKDITTTDLEQECLKYINDNKYYYYEDQGSGKRLKEHAPKKDDIKSAKATRKKNG